MGKKYLFGILLLSGVCIGVFSPAADFNGDGTDDIAIFRPTTGLWSIRNGGRFYYGNEFDAPVPADYNGDGTDEIAIFRYTTGLWAIRNGARYYYGQTGDIPLNGTGASPWHRDRAYRIFYDGSVYVDGENMGTALIVKGIESNGDTQSPLKIMSDAQVMRIDGNEIDSNTTLNLNRNVDHNVSLVTGGGNVGIGKSNPPLKLSVSADHAGNYAAEIVNDGNNANRYGLSISCGSDTGIGVNWLIGFYDGNLTPVGGISFTGGTVTYGTFTADHEASIPQEANENGYPYGTVVVLKGTRPDPARPRQAQYEVSACRKAQDKKVFGIYAGKQENQANRHSIYTAGDGHILVAADGGDIEAGDYLTTSNREGHAMRQDDDLLHNYTVAKSLEDVDWEQEGQRSKLIACTYHAQ